jgi:hypothetical protein
LTSTSAVNLAEQIIDDCLRYGTWRARDLDALVERALDESDEFVARAATRALFTIVIERLGDLFEPALCEVYAKLFSHVIARALPDYTPDDLLLRYKRMRAVRRFPGGEVRKVYVLSRVTLGADIAVTSVALAAAKERFPEAQICLVGPAKNAELFASDDRIGSVPIAYGRGSLLRDRLSAAVELQSTVDEIGAIVIDPDSRLTQLGLIPVCDDARYFFFESRAFGGDSDAALSSLTGEWVAEVFNVGILRSYVAPPRREKVADVAISWGVGENGSKRVDDDFELAILTRVLEQGRSVILDRGAGGEETERVNGLYDQLGRPTSLLLHDGSYASFAGHILNSEMFIGYDSAGQHVANAAGIPLVSVFAGYASVRTLARWSPDRATSHVIAVDEINRPTALERTLEAIAVAEAVAH